MAQGRKGHVEERNIWDVGQSAEDVRRTQNRVIHRQVVDTTPEGLAASRAASMDQWRREQFSGPRDVSSDK